MGVLAHTGVENISQIRNKSFCSPPFHPRYISQDFVKYFESRIISQKCDPDKTLLENRISSLSEYFKSSCISGLWTMDLDIDRKLKKNYSNLCSCKELYSCSDREIQDGRVTSLWCFFKGYGDLSWVNLDIQKIFPYVIKQQEYHFLCPDGSTRKETESPCIWLEIPWETIITTADTADRVMKFVRNESNYEDVMSLFLRKPYQLDTYKTPADYLQQSFSAYYSTKTSEKCRMQDRTVKWCVVSNLETEKCKWLSLAAQALGVEPLIECVQEISKEKCIKSVKNGWTDIYSIKPPLLPKARQGGLKPIAHMVSDKNTHKHEIVAIVRESSNLNYFTDLKNHKACFSSFRDAGWNSFIYMMRNLTGNEDWYARDKEMVSHFFSESCVGDLSDQNVTFRKNLYSLCSKTAESTGNANPSCSLVSRMKREFTVQRSEFSEMEECKTVDEAVLSCLVYHGADVAFVNRSIMQAHNSDNYSTDKSHPFIFLETRFKPLCLNGSMSNHSESTMCYASWKNYGSLMVHENLTRTRKEEIYLLVVELDRLFRATPGKINRQISLYGPFDGEKNVIFHSETEFLEPKDCTIRCSLDYQEVLEHVPTNGEPCNGFLQSGSPKNVAIYLFVSNVLSIIIKKI